MRKRTKKWRERRKVSKDRDMCVLMFSNFIFCGWWDVWTPCIWFGEPSEVVISKLSFNQKKTREGKREGREREGREGRERERGRKWMFYDCVYACHFPLPCYYRISCNGCAWNPSSGEWVSESLPCLCIGDLGPRLARLISPFPCPNPNECIFLLTLWVSTCHALIRVTPEIIMTGGTGVTSEAQTLESSGGIKFITNKQQQRQHKRNKGKTMKEKNKEWERRTERERE